jgi:hypothetical protein
LTGKHEASGCKKQKFTVSPALRQALNTRDDQTHRSKSIREIAAPSPNPRKVTKLVRDVGKVEGGWLVVDALGVARTV